MSQVSRRALYDVGSRCAKGASHGPGRCRVDRHRRCMYRRYCAGRAGSRRSRLEGPDGCLPSGLCGIVFVRSCGSANALVAARASGKQDTCLQNLGLLSSGIAEYTQDYDGKLPPPDRWADLIRPDITTNGSSYQKDEPGEDIWHCPTASTPFSYSLNTGVSRSNATLNPSVELFESDAKVRNACGGKQMLVNHPRHGGSDNYLFTDGHVASIRRGTTVTWSGGGK